ncbi:MAG: S46 family peptidase, partial [Bacteroidales bacterium]|nr:S46 family peptidase [Bacteroidales bacterium]
SASNRWKSALEKDFWGRWGFRVNGKRHGMATCFSTNIDFAEGMEGSPVLDPQGRLLGIVSGGTPAGIAGREMYVEGGTGTVCVDIRFIL